MKNSTILLIRHGQSEGNILGIFTGQSGCALSELGHKQAEMTAEYVCENYQIDKVYSSDLPRAIQTAEPIARLAKRAIITDARLREIDVGEWEGRRFTDVPELFPEDYAIWCNDLIHARCTGGESVLEVTRRAIDALESIAAANPGACVAVVAHGLVIRAALWKISGAPEGDMQKQEWGGNCAVSELSFVDGKLQIVSANNAEHLIGFETILPKNL